MALIYSTLILIDEDIILRELARLDESKSVGLDGTSR